jgi:hypothetical protein
VGFGVRGKLFAKSRSNSSGVPTKLNGVESATFSLSEVRFGTIVARIVVSLSRATVMSTVRPASRGMSSVNTAFLLSDFDWISIKLVKANRVFSRHTRSAIK